MDSLQPDLNEIVSGYLSAEKVARGGIAWRDKGHPDYSEATVPVFSVDFPELNGRFILTAHTNRVPYKYSFTLLLNQTRVFALDVNPACCHRNPETLESVCVTHWQTWPMTSARADDRQMSHLKWLSEFCEQAHIRRDGGYDPPPFREPQIELL